MNPHLQHLQPYPFERLRQLFADLVTSLRTRHRSPCPSVSRDTPRRPSCSRQSPPTSTGSPTTPTTAGLPGTAQRHRRLAAAPLRLPAIDADSQVLPVNGTREALFAFAQAVVSPGPDALVMSPNPFYQIYEGAALLAGRTPHFINCTAELRPAARLRQCYRAAVAAVPAAVPVQPGQPHRRGDVARTNCRTSSRLAREYDFVIASDECYSEIYFDEDAPPAGPAAGLRRHGRQ